MTRTLSLAVVAVAGLLAAAPASAAWPDKPVRIIIPNTAGGPSDIMARLLAPLLSESLGGTFVAENVGGGGGNIGTARVARADPDGYTLLLPSTAFIINPALQEKVPYDPLKDFIPVIEIGVSPNVIAVLPSLGIKSVKELVDTAGKTQDKFNIATPPVGTSSHLAAEMFKLRTGLGKVAVVFHTGGGQALQALLSGATQINIGVLGTAHSQIKAGTVLGLAVTGARRWHDLPDVPTMVDLGYTDYVTENMTSLMAPTGTPDDIVAKLEKATMAALKREDIRERLTSAGFQVTATPGSTLRTRLERELPMYRKVIVDAGIKMP